MFNNISENMSVGGIEAKNMFNTEKSNSMKQYKPTSGKYWTSFTYHTRKNMSLFPSLEKIITIITVSQDDIAPFKSSLKRTFPPMVNLNLIGFIMNCSDIIYVG